MSNIALLVLFNHRYDKNIPLLEERYKGRFTNIYYIVPFYDGERNDVIPVYANSYYFGSYISQAYTHLKGKGFTHYFIVADDMVINPSVNENNLFEILGINENDCYLPDPFVIQSFESYWSRAFDALCFEIKTPGVEISSILPSKEKALSRLSVYGYKNNKISLRVILPFKSPRLFLKNLWRWCRMGFRRFFSYPLIGGYSDIFIVTEKNMSSFSRYCGAFSAAGLFVEIALPTSLALSATSLKMSKDVKLRSGDLWGMDTREEFASKYDNKLCNLERDFPKDFFYIHPIKISQWNK